MNVSSAPDSRLRNVSRRAGHGREIIAELHARARTSQQAEAAETVLRVLARMARSGNRVDVTWPQLATACGRPTEGLTMREIKDQFERSIKRTMGYLRDWGYLESWEAVYEPNGEGRCIVVTLPAGVAQSVRAAES